MCASTAYRERVYGRYIHSQLTLAVGGVARALAGAARAEGGSGRTTTTTSAVQSLDALLKFGLRPVSRYVPGAKPESLYTPSLPTVTVQGNPEGEVGVAVTVPGTGRFGPTIPPTI
jgi:hypothetical protein